ncbi:MAG: rubrerythrin family protein, partial [Candidatus Aenigmatarchaeota archaeon]
MAKTDENLKAAFAGESQARNKYDYFAKVARNEGYHYIAKIFEETALNEMQHAKDEFKLLKGINDTKTNLKEAIAGEHYENTRMYPEFAKTAQEEGNAEAAKLFTQIAKVETEHEKRYQKLLEMVEKRTVFKRDQP